MQTLSGTIRFMALVALLVLPSPAWAEDERDDSDAQTLQQAGVPTDGPGLVAYVRTQFAADPDPQRLRVLTRQLGSTDFRVRDQAPRQLTAAGPPALVTMDAASHDADDKTATAK